MFGTDSCIGAGTSMKINGTSDFDAILLGARTSENSAYLSWGSEFQGLDTKVYFGLLMKLLLQVQQPELLRQMLLEHTGFQKIN